MAAKAKPKPVKHEVVITIEFVVNLEDMLPYGSDMEHAIESLRGIGSAEVVSMTTRPRTEEE